MSLLVRLSLRNAGVRTIGSCCHRQSSNTDNDRADAHSDPHPDGDEQ